MKRKTLLYLDSELIEKAKEENINVSKLTEGALKQALEVKVLRTAKDHLQKLLAEVGNENSIYGETCFLPFQIKSLKLVKVGPFTNFEAHFERNTVHLIHGFCGSGKSTIIRSILYAFGIRHKYFTERVFGEGEITVKLYPRQDSINITSTKRQKSLKGYQCLLADDPLERIPKDLVPSLFTELKHIRTQIILTASPLIDTLRLPNDIHVIKL